MHAVLSMGGREKAEKGRRVLHAEAQRDKIKEKIGIFCGGVYMIFLKVLAVVLGLAFLLFGYFIYFKKKYNLINGFEADFKAGRKKEEYAKKVGMIEFVVGIVLLITGVALILFA